MNVVFPLDKLPGVREMWLRGVSVSGITRHLGRSSSVIHDIVQWNTSGNRQQWSENRLELPPWIDAC